MGQDSTIEWTDRTWNPLRGCSRISPGCEHCYAEAIAARFSDVTFKGFAVRTAAGPRWTGAVTLLRDKLAEPLSWRTPARVFVNSMSDLFHEGMTDADIDQVFAAMALAPQHTFQVLTKRATRMRAYLSAQGRHDAIVEAMDMPDWLPAGRRFLRIPENWPMPNVWLGVSVENQQYADERIPQLLQTPAAVRFVSAEPLLGPVDLGLNSATCTCCRRTFASRWVDVPQPVVADWPMCALPGNERLVILLGIHRAQSNTHGALHVATPAGDLGLRPDDAEALPALDWVIVGGESGRGARPFAHDWARSLIAQCKTAGVPVFMKQLGSHHYPIYATDRDGVFIGGTTDLSGRLSKNGDIDEWPWDLRVREFPRSAE